jgi:hypothetical protein
MQQRTLAAVLCALLALAACGGRTPAPVEYRSAVPTPDGLYLIRSAPNHRVYVRPGARISSYSEILVDPLMVSYAMPAQTDGQGPAHVRTLDPEAEAKLTSILRRAFVDEMKRGHAFRLVEAPGPAALRVQGWIYDLVIEEPYRGDPRNFPLCFGQMNLILDVRDSRTAQSLARVSDLIAVSCDRGSSDLYYTASWRDVKGALRPWASFLRASLDELHQMPDLPAPPAEQPSAP